MKLALLFNEIRRRAAKHWDTPAKWVDVSLSREGGKYRARASYVAHSLSIQCLLPVRGKKPGDALVNLLAMLRERKAS